MPYLNQCIGLLRSRLLLALLGCLSLGAVAQEPASVPLPDGLQTVEFYSPAVDRMMKFDIVLPTGYEESDARYPVLYLLHGYMQNYTTWGRSFAAAWYARHLNELILVLPDGGNSWFVNYAEHDAGQTNNWEDHVVKDVVSYVDAHFRTEARREGRAIAGLSMGGFGAFALGLRNPELFVSLGSTSGALAYARTAAQTINNGIDRSPPDPLPPAQQALFDEADAIVSALVAIPGFSSQEERTPAGTDFVTAAQAEAYDPFTIIYQVPRSQMPHIYIDAGTEDSLLAVAREFIGILLLNNVPFDYMQDRGGHTGDYWRRSIGHMMTIQTEVMQRALGNRP